MPDEFSGAAPSGGGSAPPSAPGGSSGAAPAAPAPISLTRESAFIPPGGKEPVTWDKFQSGYVSKDELTRMRQRDAAERQAWQTQTQQRLQSEYEARVRQQQQAAAGQEQGNQFIQTLEKAPYVEGKVVAGIVREVAQQLAQTQQALRLLHQQNQQLQQHVSGFSGKAQQQELGSLFSQTRQQLQLPNDPIINDMMQDIYHSYTGWESEPGAFQQMVANRWQGYQQTLRNLDKQRAQAAARPPAVPGGPPRAFRQARDVKGGENAETLASRLWAGLHSGNGG
jgi:hypothetical protein